MTLIGVDGAAADRRVGCLLRAGATRDAGGSAGRAAIRVRKMRDASSSTPSQWNSFVREHLRLSGVRPEREVEIVEDLARQLDDAYREALAGGAAESEARDVATRHFSDWRALSDEISAAETQKNSALTDWQNRAEARATPKIRSL